MCDPEEFCYLVRSIMISKVKICSVHFASIIAPYASPVRFMLYVPMPCLAESDLEV